jgi:hypothetical protein
MKEDLVSFGYAVLGPIRRFLWASMEVEIRNQCSGFKLTSPVYFCDDAVCYIPLDQRVASNYSTRIKFRVDLNRFMSRGGIMYEVRATSTSSDETSANNTMTEINGNVSTSMQLLVTWEISRIHDPCLFTILLEHDSTFTWNEDKLRQLIFEEHTNRFRVMNG